MNAATLLSLVACAIEIVVGGLAFAFAGAPGWRHFKTFSLIAFSAAIYSAGNVVFAAGIEDTTIIPWVARLNIAVACVHCALWVIYVRQQYGDPVRARDRRVVGLLAGLAVLCFVPGLVMRDDVIAQRIAWAGVNYQVVRMSAFGNLLTLAIPLALLGPAVAYVRKARLGAAGARTHVFGFCVFFAAAVNEALVSQGTLQSLYLADLGFLAAVVSVSAEMTYRVTGDARRLQTLSADLSRQVEERTRELTEARDKLENAERLAALGRMSASIGHEINNPLSYVLGNLEYVRSELELQGAEAPLVDALRDAVSGADRIRKIVQELRAFSRGGDHGQREPVDVTETLETAIKLVWGEIRHRARLERNLSATPRVLAEPTKLTQVFVNVLMNGAQAIPEKAGPANAVLRLRSTTRADDMVVVEIEDTGVGIAEADRPRLFEPFFSTKPHDKGNGLGLFVSFGIVSALGGRIEVESELGRGTLVRVLIPAFRGDHAAPKLISAPPRPLLASRRILIVDDDLLVARTLARQLSGHTVEVAGNGREALALLESRGHAFDLVLCDLMMPDLTGMDVFEEAERRWPHLAHRFVFISGGGVNERSRQFIERHAARLVTKPIDSRQLSKLLAEGEETRRGGLSA
jgi:signal transduction histidine kinase/ActR/RegA family two-component response regulator